MAATKKEMSDLHALLAASLVEQIKDREPTPSMLNVARQFLRDCNIEVDPTNKPAGVAELEQAFDEYADEDLPTFN